MAQYPVVTLLEHKHKRLLAGHPWVYSNEIKMDAAAKALDAGAVVRLESSDGRFLAHAHFNPRTLIAARVLTRSDAAIDKDFWKKRLAAALALRQRLCAVDYYRLIHAEADHMPGMVIDRFGDTLVLQPGTAGMQAAVDDIALACRNVMPVKNIILRGDAPVRALEGLSEDIRVLHGTAPAVLEAHENGLVYYADALEGQKTGWFYDQRANRAMVANLARGKTVLDLYTHTGGFGLLAMQRGATQALCVDRSEGALKLAAKTAEAAKLKADFEKAEVFEFCEKNKDRRFDVVVADPPAFAKSKKDVGPASKGYRKLARMAATLVAPSGLFFMASCSHAITRERFDEEVLRGVHEAGRSARILARTGADMDHPAHPALPENSYLKGLLLHVD